MVGTDGRGRASPPGTAFCIPHRLGTTSADLGRPCCRLRSRGPSRGLTWPAGSPAPASWNPSALGPRPPALSSAEQSLAPRPTGQRPCPPSRQVRMACPIPAPPRAPLSGTQHPRRTALGGQDSGTPFWGAVFSPTHEALRPPCRHPWKDGASAGGKDGPAGGKDGPAGLQLQRFLRPGPQVHCGCPGALTAPPGPPALALHHSTVRVWFVLPPSAPTRGSATPWCLLRDAAGRRGLAGSGPLGAPRSGQMAREQH